MEAEFTAKAGETVLATAKCLDHRGPVAFSGTLTLTDERLHFAPTRLNRAVGAKAWQLPVADVESAEEGGLDKAVVLKAGDITRRLGGADAAELFELLRVLVAEQSGTPVAGASFATGERILLAGEVELYKNDLLSTPGRLTLTDRRLRFKPGKRLERLIWGGAGLDAALSEVRSAKVIGARRRLTVQIGDRKCVFGGALVPRLHGLLVVLRTDGDAAGILGSWTCFVFKGPLAQGGELVFGHRRLVFTPSGKLESFMGIGKATKLRLVDLTRVVVRGALDARLTLKTAKEEIELAVPEPRERVDDLFPLLLHLDGKDEPRPVAPGKGPDPAAVAALLERWRAHIGELQAEDLRMFGPAVERLKGLGLRRGWIGLSTAGAVFLPAGGPESGERPTSVPLGAMGLPDDGAEVGADLLLDPEGVRLHVFPRGGASFVGRYLVRWERALREADVARRKKKVVRHVEEEEPDNLRASYRIESVRNKKARLILPTGGEDGWGAVLDTRLKDVSMGGCGLYCNQEVPLGTEVEVDIGQGLDLGPVPATVVFCRRRWKGEWSLGLQFSMASRDMTARIRDAVLKLQRIALAERAEEREG